jgi:hypothetical protein
MKFIDIMRRRAREREHQRKSDPMPHWQYRMNQLNDLPRKTDEIDLLNDTGEEGWELVAIAANNVAYLKRQIARPLTPSARSPSQGT